MTSQKVVIVTGCVSGIGLATAERLARDPDQRFLVIATVISLDLKGDLVAAVGDVLDKTVFITKMDITNDDDISSVVSDVISRHERIDVVVNIAGIGPCTFLDTMARSEIEKVFNVNTIGIIRLTQAVLPHMKSNRAGRIIAVTSSNARMGGPLLEIYSASKYAVEGFFESLAPVARKFNIGVSCVEPGAVDTPMLHTVSTEIEKVNEARTDLDIDLARAFAKKVRDNKMISSPSDVTNVIMTAMTAEKPMLRYPVGAQLAKLLSIALADTSGETAIQIITKTIED